jgi:hypothetical protein
MKKIALSVAAIFCLPVGSAFAAGGFALSCTDIAMSGTALVAKCKNAAGTVVDAKLELDKRMYVSGTTMMPMQGAPTFATSKCTSLVITGSTLSATCNRTVAKYDLNKAVANIDGVLKFQ